MAELVDEEVTSYDVNECKELGDGAREECVIKPSVVDEVEVTFPWGPGAAPGATEEAPTVVTGGVEDEGDEDLDDAKVGAADGASARIAMGWL